MTIAPATIAIRPGEHACCRFTRPEERERLADAFIHVGLRLGTGSSASAIDYVDRDTYYTRPEDALAGYDAQVRRYLQAGAPRVRVFGELPLCRTQQESDTWILYEALLNPAFAHHPVTIVRGLDAREQPDSVLEGSFATHPTTLHDGWSDNAHYHGPGLDDPLAGYLPPRPGHGGGAALWVARQASRRLDMVSTERGLTTRLWV